jgi:hypothetical protein
MRDAGEPVSRGQRDRRAAQRRALREALLFSVVLGGVVIINAVLGLLLIDFFASLDGEPGMPVHAGWDGEVLEGAAP